MNEQFFGTLYDAMSQFAHLSNNKIVFATINKVSIDEVSKDMEPSNLTQRQLVLKIRKDGPIQISKIADWLEMKRPNATRLANSLVKLGICEKIQKTDKRYVYLDLSRKGKQILDEETRLAKLHYKEIFDKYISDEELKILLDSCNSINEILAKLP